MIKIFQFKKLLLLFVIILFASFATQAQTPIWGAATSGTASPIGVAEGTLSTPFATANIHPYNINQLSTTQWTSYSLYQCDTSSAPQIQTSNDSAHWKRLQAPYDTTGHGPNIVDPLNQINYSIGWPSGSSGAADGVAVFDSDYLNSSGAYNGIHGDFSLAQTCFNHKGELVSPRIDLSAAQQNGTDLSLEFYVLHRLYPHSPISHELTVSFSYDDGATWHITQDIIPFTAERVPNFPVFNLSPFLGGTTISIPLGNTWSGYNALVGHNSTQCRMKFTCAAMYYYAFIDDVSIISQPDVDLAFATSDPNGSILDQASVIQVSNAYCTPSNQIDFSQFLLGGRVANRGKTMVTNVPVHLTIDKRDSSGNYCFFYKDTILVDTIFGNDLGRLSEVDTFKESNFVSGYNLINLKEGTSDYVCNYEIMAPSNDYRSINNITSHTFSITENYWSKVRQTEEGYPHTNAYGLIPTTNLLDNMEWGSVFYVVNTDVLDSVRFQYYVPHKYTGADTQQIKVYVHEWNDLNGDGMVDSSGTYANSELTLKGDGVIVLSGLTVSSLPKPAVVEVNAFPGGGLLSLQAGKRYLVSLAQGKDHGGSSFSNTTTVLFGGDSRMDYSYNMFADADFDLYSAGGDIDHYPNNTWPSVLYVDEQGGTSNGWSTTGFGGRLVPSITLVMSPKNINASLCFVIVGVDDIEKTNKGEIVVYPNPTNNNINIEVNFEREAEKLDYLLTDMVGRVLYREESNNVLTEVKTFDLNKLPSGVYFVIIRSDNGTMTKRFIKQ
ncbi:MAG: T9SS type A sorting domain-containing protein [Aureispira sp.]|nr:T9SS type A sorting domain-containing protein [Aureispira sp.]